jgi:hypothetical protein
MNSCNGVVVCYLDSFRSDSSNQWLYTTHITTSTCPKQKHYFNNICVSLHCA